MIKTREEMTDLADRVRDQNLTTDYWRGVEDALRWATGTADPKPLAALQDPMQLIHKARPVRAIRDTPPTDGESCAVCGETIRRVPGGNGPVWVHADTGTVVGSGGEPWAVVDGNIEPGAAGWVLGQFATEEEGTEFIATLPDSAAGRYAVDGPRGDRP